MHNPIRRQWPTLRDSPEASQEQPPPEDAAPPPAVDPWADPPPGHAPAAPTEHAATHAAPAATHPAATRPAALPPDAGPAASPPVADDFADPRAPISPAGPAPAGAAVAEPEARTEGPGKPAVPAVPELPTGPADLPGTAPTIGRAGAPHLGRVNPDIALRPPAVSLDGTTAGDFRVAAASLIGTGHLVSGHPRQDAYNFMAGRSGRLYVAIADGLGSKPASQLGAHLFVESVLVVAAHAEAEAEAEEIVPSPADLLSRASLRTAQIVEEAYHLDPRAVGFVGAVAVFSGRHCLVARIGDVSAFTLADGEFTEAFAADDGLVNIVSASMPGEKESDIEVVGLPPAPVAVFGTDGLVNDIRNSEQLRVWLAGQWQRPHLPFAIGDTLRYRRQGSHDDRTAVVVWQQDGADET